MFGGRFFPRTKSNQLFSTYIRGKFIIQPKLVFNFPDRTGSKSSSVPIATHRAELFGTDAAQHTSQRL